MVQLINDLSPEDAQAEAFRIMNEAGLVARVGAPLGTVKDGWPCLEYETYYRKQSDPETVTRLQLDYRLGLGHVKREHWQTIRDGHPDFDLAFAHIAGRKIKPEFMAKQAKIAERLAHKLSLVRPSEVLAAHAEDAITAILSTFEDWASDFGMDADSRKAEHMYNTCRDILPRLLRVLDMGQVERLAELHRMF